MANVEHQIERRDTYHILSDIFLYTDHIRSDYRTFYLLDTFRRICCFQSYIEIYVAFNQIGILRSFLSHRDTLIVFITL